jgi:hypothetical protein
VGTTRSDARPAASGGRYLRRAWAAVASLPVALILAIVTGEGLLAILGYDSGDSAIPVTAVLVAATPALLILSAPGAAAVFYGREAYRAGAREGVLPAWIGGAAVGLLLVVNVAAFVVSR